MQTEKRKNRPLEDSLDEEVNLEDLHRDDYDEEDLSYVEDDPLPEKRKNQPVVAYDRRCRTRRKVLLVVLGLAFFLAFSTSFAVRRTINTAGIDSIASGLGQNLAHDLSSSLVPGIVSIIPLLLILFGVVFIVRVARRRYRD